MEAVWVPLSIASVLTAGVALRLDMSQRPCWLLVYFCFFLALEMAAEHWLLPEGTLGMEIAWVCFGLTIPLTAASVLWRRYERRLAEADAEDAT
ncbi:MAG: hypothetical protein CL910_02995 [Deltaproteobacteria bacterium]|nr:hypothetical protein [Deltaproteobacteria bacterium]